MANIPYTGSNAEQATPPRPQPSSNADQAGSDDQKYYWSFKEGFGSFESSHPTAYATFLFLSAVWQMANNIALGLVLVSIYDWVLDRWAASKRVDLKDWRYKVLKYLTAGTLQDWIMRSLNKV
ncbi:hypothetical protein BJ508DRAFT_132122 [Ascobolus immersus RN42]|uniref:Uncharacterized protein n=1 Tax=Ascobolus immersus RN42 TaxID=1160509 RepID=A0A3N4I1X4_ASCIM|nr:hypothetical protein BJ508DRAFT_132122 [Ascobolus immersus RN42]